MSDPDIRILVDELLKNGGIKIYTDERTLASLPCDIGDTGMPPDESDSVNYIKAVEGEFRSNADGILEMLELTHLQVVPKTSDPNESG